MKDITRSVLKVFALSGWAALTVSGMAVADSEEEILERIRPIGKVNVIQPAAPAPAPTPAAAAKPAPATTAAPPAAAPAAAPETPAPAVALAPADGDKANGKKTYDSVCFVCHMAGISNAPKLGDKEAWAPRIAKGKDALIQSSIKGIPGTAMPPRGTCATCSDADLIAAVDYMVSQVQ